MSSASARGNAFSETIVVYLLVTVVNVVGLDCVEVATSSYDEVRCCCYCCG